MIKSWQHKGLKLFYLTGKKSRIRPQHARRIKLILQLLDSVKCVEQLDLPGFNLHPLKGNLKKFYAITVQANWRIIFQFDGENIILVDYLDYH